MDEHTLRVLEYYKVRELMAEHASSHPGREAAGRVLPSSDHKEVEKSLKETDDLRKFIETRHDFPIAGLKDIATQLRKSAVEGSILQPMELLDVAGVARASRLMKAALGRGKGDSALLGARAEHLGVFEILESDFGRAIGEDGEVLDSASFELKRIRRSLGLARSRINKELESIIQDPNTGKAVQEPIITVRGERYVLPLKQNFRLYLQGIVHDHSSSGSTVFVEPQKTVELNNKLAQLKVDEKHEVERILYQLTAVVRENGEGLTASFFALVALDVLYAKARYGLATRASKPSVATNGVVALRDARHPLLIKTKGADKTVPLDVRLGSEFTTLVVTGPNTGGKTVALKTIGISCLMAQSGMLVPAADDSVISVFQDILSDIGDEQSLEQSLSTFSSHMTQIVRIIGTAGKNTLVLLDELGAGTDPAEGSALGLAILEELRRLGARVVVTTHHGSHKVYAANTPGVMNASVEFDPESLQPTYRLLAGRPGRSNALVVAERIGMPKRVIEAAAGIRGSDAAELDSLIERLEKEAQAAREDRMKAAREAQAARDEKARLQEIVRRADEERVEAVRKAKEKAANVVSSLRYKLRELEELVKNRQPDRAEVKAQTEEVRKLEAQLTAQETTPEPARHDSVKIESLSAGDTVRVFKYRKSGKVLSVDRNKGRVVVQLDSMKVTLGVDELEPVQGASKKADAQPDRKSASAYTFSRTDDDDGGVSELNIIGVRFEEAMTKVEKFIDQSMLAGLGQIRIIHGRGTGALRKGVSDFLRGNPGVKGYHHAAFEEGGDAVTVAELK